MSTYVMSDLHGEYKAYISMLKKINFKDEDMLYILGDILDRGPNPIKIILDLMERPNVKVIMGNHCVMACECLSFLLQKMKEETPPKLEEIDREMLEKISNWQQNGGVSTTNEFHKYDKKIKEEIVTFISKFKAYAEIEAGGNTFILVHAGLKNFKLDKQLSEYELDELVWEQADYESKYFEDKYVITGHTPTMFIENNERKDCIYQGNNHIAIDCGCSFPDGRLGCLRLDDMKEFYVEL